MEDSTTKEEHKDVRPSFWHTVWTMGCGDGTPTDRRNIRKINQLSMAWGGSIVLVAWLIVHWELPAAVNWLLVLVPNAIAFFALRAYLTLLQMTDELIRRIHLEGLAVAFGATYLFAVGYLLAEAAGAPELDVVFLILFMTVAWLYGNIRALRQFQ